MTKEEFIGMVAGVVVGALIIIVAIILLTVPPIRKRIFPHRDKENFVPAKEKAIPNHLPD